MHEATLESSPIRLRPVESGDLDFVLGLQNDLEIKTLTLGWRLPVSRDACEAWIAERLRATDEATWIVTNHGEQAGVLRVMDIDSFSRRAEIGVYLQGVARGSGVGEACVRLATDWCFKFLGLHRVTARVLARNAPALATFEKLGFSREGVLVDHEYREGSYEDVVLLARIEAKA